jgi:uncharacterized Zn finger protein (UPF0148 family)
MSEEKKLTDKQVFTAIEKCFAFPNRCEDGCPYFNKNGRNFCVEHKAFYNDLKRIVTEHAEQNAEIERLTEEKKTLVWLNQDLKKQVDELTDKLGKVLSGIKMDELLVAKGIEQAVKDTAKEMWKKAKHFYRQYPLSTEVGFCCFRDWIKERYGVEVE